MPPTRAMAGKKWTSEIGLFVATKTPRRTTWQDGEKPHPGDRSPMPIARSHAYDINDRRTDRLHRCAINVGW
jgi:hypothetical protein